MMVTRYIKNTLKSLALVAMALAGDLAQAAQTTTKNPSGFYMGLQGGLSAFTGTLRSVHDMADGDIFSQKAKARKNAGFAGVLAGYRLYTDSGLTLGFEVAANHGIKETLVKDNPTFNAFKMREKLKRTWAVRPAFTLGHTFADKWHVYMGLGVEFSRFQTTVQNFGDLDQPTAQPIASLSKKRTRVAFSPSLGLEYALTKNILFGMQVTLTRYGRVNQHFGGEIQPELGDGGYTSSIRPKFLQTALRLTYRM